MVPRPAVQILPTIVRVEVQTCQGAEAILANPASSDVRERAQWHRQDAGRGGELAPVAEVREVNRRQWEGLSWPRADCGRHTRATSVGGASGYPKRVRG